MMSHRDVQNLCKSSSCLQFIEIIVINCQFAKYIDTMSKHHHRSRSPIDLWYLSLITPLSSDMGQELFSASLHRSFDRLYPYFELQERSYFCSVACATILLNTLLPSVKWTQPTLYSRVAQAHMFQGMTLTNLSDVLKICDLPSTIHYCEDERVEEQFRQDIQNQNNFVIVNYWRQFPGSDENHSYRYGHFGLVAAFDETSDQVLIMDTSNAKYPQHWLGVKSLVRMMCTDDRTAAMSRGYLVITNQR